MRINRPPYLVPGDIICCPSCARELMHVKRFVLRNQPLLAQDFRPLEDKWLIRAHALTICFECGKHLLEEGLFKSVQRGSK